MTVSPQLAHTIETHMEPLLLIFKFIRRYGKPVSNTNRTNDKYEPQPYTLADMSHSAPGD